MAAGERAAEPLAELSHYVVARPIYSEAGFQDENERRPPLPPTLRERAQAACRWVPGGGPARSWGPPPTPEVPRGLPAPRGGGGWPGVRRPLRSPAAPRGFCCLRRARTRAHVGGFLQEVASGAAGGAQGSISAS